MPRLFNFQLRELAAIEPFGGERPTLHWFGLSDGWYWLTVGGSELFRYDRAFMRREEPWCAEPTALPYVDYYVVRLWEDLLEQLPAVLAPVPSELAERVADAVRWRDWQERASRWLDALDEHGDQAAFDAAVDLVEAACGWWVERRLDTGYLRHGPRLRFWRVGDTIHLRWDDRGERLEGLPIWAARAGEATLPADAFLAEVRAFDRRFIAAMGERVAAAHAHWPHPNVAIDLGQLAREQQERAGWLARSLKRAAQPVAVDWRAVLDAIARLERSLTP